MRLSGEILAAKNAAKSGVVRREKRKIVIPDKHFAPVIFNVTHVCEASGTIEASKRKTLLTRANTKRPTRAAVLRRINPPGPCGLSRLSSLHSLSSFGREGVPLSKSLSRASKANTCLLLFAAAPFTKVYKLHSESLQKCKC